MNKKTTLTSDHSRSPVRVFVVQRFFKAFLPSESARRASVSQNVVFIVTPSKRFNNLRIIAASLSAHQSRQQRHRTAKLHQRQRQIDRRFFCIF